MVINVLEIVTKLEIVKIIKLMYTDDSILDYIISYNCAIANIDKNLIKRSISQKIMVFSLKNNKIRIINV